MTDGDSSNQRYDWESHADEMTKEEIREKLDEEHDREEFGISSPSSDTLFRGDLVVDRDDPLEAAEPLYYCGDSEKQTHGYPDYPASATTAVVYRERELDEHLPGWQAMDIHLLHELARDRPGIEKLTLPKARLRRYERDER